jgi:hypothetical protein
MIPDDVRKWKRISGLEARDVIVVYIVRTGM